MGSFLYKQKLELIDKTGKDKNWGKKIGKLSKDIYLHVTQNDGNSAPWIMICNAKFNGSKIDVTETIRDHLPQHTDQPGMVIMVIEGHHDFEPYYPDSRIKYITFVDMDFNETYRLRESLNGFISKEEPIRCVVERNSNSTEVYGNQTMGRQVHIVKNEGSGNILAISTQGQKDIQTFLQEHPSVESIQCVVHHIEEMESYDVKDCRGEGKGRQVDIVKEEGIDGTFLIRNKVREGIQTFLRENPSDEIDVIMQIQGESPTICNYLKDIVTAKIKDVKVNFLQAKKVPTHLWIFVCDKFVENEFLELKDASKGNKSMVLRLHDCQKISSKIGDVAKDDNKPTIYLVLENSETGDSLYMESFEKKELQSILEQISTGNDEDFPQTLHRNRYEESTRRVGEMNSDTIKVFGNQNMDRQVHIIVGLDGILVNSTQAPKDIQTFLHDNPSGKIDVMAQVQDESTRVCTYEYFKRLLTAERKDANVNFLQADSVPTHPWVFVYDAFDENKFLKLKKSSKVPVIRCVVHHVAEMKSCDIKVYENQDKGRQAHTVEKEGIDGTFIISTQARKDIEAFLKKNQSGEIDVKVQIQGESTTVYELESIVTAEMKNVKVNFLQADNAPTHPWIFVCDAFDENKFHKLKKSSKGNGSMVLRLHGCQRIPLKDIHVHKDDNKPTIYLVLGNSVIDISVYMTNVERQELRRIWEPISTGNVSGDNENNGNSECKREKRVYIKCIADLPKRAISYFIERYIKRIEPIWITGEDPIEEGSLCIVVCFNLSRLQDEIAAVLQVTPQDCKSMLVVIQNCQIGMSPKPMRRSIPNDKIIDFANILYEDGKCYNCVVNSEAKEKIQAFIDNN